MQTFFEAVNSRAASPITPQVSRMGRVRRNFQKIASFSMVGESLDALLGMGFAIRSRRPVHCRVEDPAEDVARTAGQFRRSWPVIDAIHGFMTHEWHRNLTPATSSRRMKCSYEAAAGVEWLLHWQAESKQQINKTYQGVNKGSRLHCHAGDLIRTEWGQMRLLRAHGSGSSG